MTSFTFKNNNPLAIMFAPWERAYGAVPGGRGTGGQLARFPSAELGYAAGVRLQNKYQDGGHRSVAQRIERWSPAKGKGNTAAATRNYINAVAAALGIDPNTPFDINDPVLGPKFLDAQAKFEAGAAVNPFPPEALNAGFKRQAGVASLVPPADIPNVPAAGQVPGGPPRVLRKGATDAKTGGAVTRLQQQLTNAGFDIGRYGVDGRFGKDTAAAVRAVERQYGLPTRDRGVAGPQVQAALAKAVGVPGGPGAGLSAGVVPPIARPFASGNLYPGRTQADIITGPPDPAAPPLVPPVSAAVPGGPGAGLSAGVAPPLSTFPARPERTDWRIGPSLGGPVVGGLAQPYGATRGGNPSGPAGMDPSLNWMGGQGSPVAGGGPVTPASVKGDLAARPYNYPGPVPPLKDYVTALPDPNAPPLVPPAVVASSTPYAGTRGRSGASRFTPTARFVARSNTEMTRGLAHQREAADRARRATLEANKDRVWPTPPLPPLYSDDGTDYGETALADTPAGQWMLKNGGDLSQSGVVPTGTKIADGVPGGPVVGGLGAQQWSSLQQSDPTGGQVDANFSTFSPMPPSDDGGWRTVVGEDITPPETPAGGPPAPSLDTIYALNSRIDPNMGSGQDASDQAIRAALPGAFAKATEAKAAAMPYPSMVAGRPDYPAPNSWTGPGLFERMGEGLSSDLDYVFGSTDPAAAKSNPPPPAVPAPPMPGSPGALYGGFEYTPPQQQSSLSAVPYTPTSLGGDLSRLGTPGERTEDVPGEAVGGPLAGSGVTGADRLFDPTPIGGPPGSFAPAGDLGGPGPVPAGTPDPAAPTSPDMSITDDPRRYPDTRVGPPGAVAGRQAIGVKQVPSLSTGKRIGLGAAATAGNAFLPGIGMLINAIGGSMLRGSLDNAQPYTGGPVTSYERASSPWGNYTTGSSPSASMFTPLGAGWQAPNFSPVSGGPLYATNPLTHTYIDSRGREHPYS